MTIKAERDLTSILSAFALTGSNSTHDECVDIRDLVVRIQSEDPKTRKIARKTLLNIIYESTKHKAKNT
ncbi:hypothetical protein [Yokenella regensburgei]|uniref:hypothetical protein n=1 Tax=Yokenella regensburgei TaxID=158877 RepID=UPI001432FE27|nr:hypothetical protein [Yokenella regensburgei]QIU88254.1 hypothetical protein HEC60_02145 [Yokenella regensburgei]